MIKEHITWRKATEEELQKGSPEMIIDSIESMEVADLPIEKIDLSNIDINTLTDSQINDLKKRFGL